MHHTIIMGTPQGQLLITVVPGLIRVLFHLGGEATLMTCECSVFQVALAQREKNQKGAVSSAPAGQSWDKGSHQTFRVTTLNFS